MDIELEESVPQEILDIIQKHGIEPIRLVLENTLVEFQVRSKKCFDDAEKKRKKIDPHQDKLDFYTRHPQGLHVFSEFCKANYVNELNCLIKLYDLLELEDDYVAFMIQFNQIWHEIKHGNTHQKIHLEKEDDDMLRHVHTAYWDSTSGKPKPLKMNYNTVTTWTRTTRTVPTGIMPSQHIKVQGHKVERDREKNQDDAGGKKQTAWTQSTASLASKDRNEKVKLGQVRSENLDQEKSSKGKSKSKGSTDDGDDPGDDEKKALEKAEVKKEKKTKGKSKSKGSADDGEDPGDDVEEDDGNKALEKTEVKKVKKTKEKSKSKGSTDDGDDPGDDVEEDDEKKALEKAEVKKEKKTKGKNKSKGSADDGDYPGDDVEEDDGNKALEKTEVKKVKKTKEKSKSKGSTDDGDDPGDDVEEDDEKKALEKTKVKKEKKTKEKS